MTVIKRSGFIWLRAILLIVASLFGFIFGVLGLIGPDWGQIFLGIVILWWSVKWFIRQLLLLAHPNILAYDDDRLILYPDSKQEKRAKWTSITRIYLHDEFITVRGRKQHHWYLTIDIDFKLFAAIPTWKASVDRDSICQQLNEKLAKYTYVKEE